jgi:hypothetical protein
MWEDGVHLVMEGGGGKYGAGSGGQTWITRSAARRIRVVGLVGSRR